MGFFHKIIEFIKLGVWETDESEVRATKKWGWLLRPFKITIMTARGLGEHNVNISSSALSFYTLTAIVPIAAMIFGLMKGFGLETALNDYLYNQFPDYTALVDQIMTFGNNMLMRTRGGIVASAGFVFLLWSVMMVFSNIERAFNNIWEIKKSRSFARKFADYVAVVFVAPMLWIISNTMIVYIRNRVTDFTAAWLGDVIFSLISVVAIWLMFAFIYFVLPNTRVKLKGALIAGVIAGSVFQLFQWGYVWLQSYMTSYNAIYGVFAAIPLFFIWLSTSWKILLFGAELSFAYQNVSKYEMEREGLHMSNNQKRKVMLATMMTIIRHFVTEQSAINSETVAEELNMPLRTVRDVIYDLEMAGMVVAIKDNVNDKVNLYMPARDIYSISAWDVIESVDNNPESKIQFTGNRELEQMSEMLDGVRHKTYDSVLNVPLVDLIEGIPHRNHCSSEQVKSAVESAKK